MRNHIPCRVCGKSHKNPRSSSICHDCGKAERLHGSKGTPCCICGVRHRNPKSCVKCPDCAKKINANAKRIKAENLLHSRTRKRLSNKYIHDCHSVGDGINEARRKFIETLADRHTGINGTNHTMVGLDEIAPYKSVSDYKLRLEQIRIQRERRNFRLTVAAVTVTVTALLTLAIISGVK